MNGFPPRFVRCAIAGAVVMLAASTPCRALYGIIDLGTLGGSTKAMAINDLGQVVGTSDLTPGSPVAFKWDIHTRHMVPLDGLGGDVSYAYDINNAGQVVGAAETADFSLHAAMWNPGDPVLDLNPPQNTTSLATAINNPGTVVIQSRVATRPGTGLVLWDPADGFNDYGPLSGHDALGWDINRRPGRRAVDGPGLHRRRRAAMVTG